METMCASFAPVADEKCRVLVLGSMPGVASLRARQYYAHPRNALWPLLYALWDRPTPDEAYEARLAFALAHRVAIWDIAKECLRVASSDASMRDIAPNDIAGLFARYPSIHTVFCNGRLAHSLYTRLADEAGIDKRCVLLPSTSPAYTLPYADKLAAWRVVREAAEALI